MYNNEIIADRIEVIVQRMLQQSNQLEIAVSDYSIIYDPGKYASWIIVIYFADQTALKNALTNGGCYFIYTFLNNGLNNAVETINIDCDILFEQGNRPVEKVDIDSFIEKLIQKRENQKNATEGICGSCGHDFDKHELMCNLDEENKTPSAGWIVCPEPDCNCFGTWGANYKPADE